MNFSYNLLQLLATSSNCCTRNLCITTDFQPTSGALRVENWLTCSAVWNSELRRVDQWVGKVVRWLCHSVCDLVCQTSLTDFLQHHFIVNLRILRSCWWKRSKGPAKTNLNRSQETSSSVAIFAYREFKQAQSQRANHGWTSNIPQTFLQFIASLKNKHWDTLRTSATWKNDRLGGDAAGISWTSEVVFKVKE